ncbi:MAG: sigma-54-dependent transcriptional regulator, partial [Nannocystaceae bacterium]
YGEVGTGKVPVARAIHAASENSSIVRVLNCAVHGERTAYELLFGVDGADGWLMETGSTLILADVEHLTGTVQERLHVALAEAGTADTPRGARIISTTALDMQDEMDSGRFLPSLGRMLSTVRIRVPTLRERHAELVPMIQGAFAEAAARYHVKEPRLSSDALEAMVGYSWPGNLRELRQVVERAVLLSEGEEVLISHFPEGLCVNSNQLRLPLVPGASLRELERFTLLETLEQVGGSTTKAAKILGISPRKIQYRLNEYREEELAARSAGAEKR